uniref:CBF/DREB1-like transcription factor n=1 Tax=Fagopyrum esculentum TaxID=3617 RepID=A0A088AX74_FAGES|nr:CBF/DREB1-like transcription factor [Fagopyrum esculentum]
MDSFSAGGLKLAATNPKKRAGRKKFRETRHPIYRGVRERNSGKWVCEIRHANNNKSRIWLGTFPTADMAARAHDVAAIALRGSDACLNFADSAWRLPVPDSGSTRDIQRAAAQAAEAFRPENVAAETVAAAGDGSREKSEVEDVFWMDHEELMVDMYNGIMLQLPFTDDVVYNEALESDVDLPLWSYSI